MKESQIQRHAEKINRKVRQKKRNKKILIASLASVAAAAVIALNLVLFVPYTAGGYDISRYKNSEYYSLMGKIGDMTYHPYTTNNFQEWGVDTALEDMVGAGPPSYVYDPSDGNAEASDPNQGDDSLQEELWHDPTYEEVTNNQVKGVIEGDLFKRSSEYLYYVTWQASRYVLSVYSIADEQFLSAILITPEEGEYFEDEGGSELFLSKDLRTVTLFTMCRMWGYWDYKLYTKAISIDVSNPMDLKIEKSFYVTGGYVSARAIDGNFLLATTFTFGRPSFEYEEDFLPQCGEDLGELKSFPMADIYVPEECKRTCYTNLILLSEDLTVLDRAALFSYTSEMYVSSDRLFVAREVEERKATGELVTNTEIACYSHAGELTYEGTVTVPGTIVNQYSMDEYQETLRVVTTYYCVREERPWHPECNLFVFDLNSFEQVAAVLDFSEPEESVKSVRFDGEKAYVCTAKAEQQTTPNKKYELYEYILCDPVFEFDLSDLNNITWKDTGEITGFSMSLTKFKDGTLLGIGYGERAGTLSEFKVEIYRTEENGVVPIARYTVDYCTFAKDFKAYMIDAERGLLGLGIVYYQDGPGRRPIPQNSYLLLRFDGEKIELVREIPINSSSYPPSELLRACIIGEKLFVVGPDFFKVIDI